MQFAQIRFAKNRTLPQITFQKPLGRFLAVYFESRRTARPCARCRAFFANTQSLLLTSCLPRLLFPPNYVISITVQAALHGWGKHRMIVIKPEVHVLYLPSVSFLCMPLMRWISMPRHQCPMDVVDTSHGRRSPLQIGKDSTFSLLY